MLQGWDDAIWPNNEEEEQEEDFGSIKGEVSQGKIEFGFQV